MDVKGSPLGHSQTAKCDKQTSIACYNEFDEIILKFH